MSYELYKVLHVFGILMLIAGLCGLWGVYSAGQPVLKSQRIGLALIHGFGMALILISGFGMLARLGFMSQIPLWTYAKMVIWLILGGSMALAKRRAGLGLRLVLLWVALGGAAGYLAIFKPF